MNKCPDCGGKVKDGKCQKCGYKMKDEKSKGKGKFPFPPKKGK